MLIIYNQFSFDISLFREISALIPNNFDETFSFVKRNFLGKILCLVNRCISFIALEKNTCELRRMLTWAASKCCENYDLDDELEKKMLRRMFDLLRPFLAGWGLFPLDFTLPIDDAGVSLLADGSFTSWVVNFTDVGVMSSVSRLSGMLLDPLLLSNDIALCWSFVRCAIRLCIEVMLVESRSELRNERTLLKLALSAAIS